MQHNTFQPTKDAASLRSMRCCSSCTYVATPANSAARRANTATIVVTSDRISATPVQRELCRGACTQVLTRNCKSAAGAGPAGEIQGVICGNFKACYAYGAHARQYIESICSTHVDNSLKTVAYRQALCLIGHIHEVSCPLSGASSRVRGDTGDITQQTRSPYK